MEPVGKSWTAWDELDEDRMRLRCQQDYLDEKKGEEQEKEKEEEKWADAKTK